MSNPMASGFVGAAERMSAADLPAAAAAHNFPVDMLQALLDVEACGSGFDGASRPKMLSEPHVLWRTLGEGPQRDSLVRAGVCYPNWGEKPYPPTSDLNYARLRLWCAVDEEAALASCSWGIGQVMGNNHAMCGYDTAADMVTACMASEAAQFDCVLAYLEHRGLGDAVRARDCLTIARGYNGQGAAEAYAYRLQQALVRRRTGYSIQAPVSLVRSTKTDRTRVLPLRAAPPTANTLNDAEWLRVRAGVA